jgi:tetratricopeptide (TPR) repeat protein
MARDDAHAALLAGDPIRRRGGTPEHPAPKHNNAKGNVAAKRQPPLIAFRILPDIYENASKPAGQHSAAPGGKRMRESDILYNKGLELLRQGEYRKAEEIFSKARELSDNEKKAI